MKKFFMFLAAAMCFTGFYSCENNDDEGNQNNPPVQNYLTDVSIEKLKAISGFSREEVDSLMNANSYSLADSIQESGTNMLMYSTEGNTMYIIYMIEGQVFGTSYVVSEPHAKTGVSKHKEMSLIAKNYAEKNQDIVYSAAILDINEEESYYDTDIEYFNALELIADKPEFVAGMEEYYININTDNDVMRNMLTVGPNENNYIAMLTYLNANFKSVKSDVQFQGMFIKTLLDNLK